jgi:hypothetical protein
MEVLIKAESVTPIAFLVTLFVIVLIFWPTWRRERRLKRWQIILLFAAPLAVMIGIGILINILQMPSKTAFDNEIPSYKVVKNSPSGEAYLRGKVVVIDKNVDRLHDIYYDLPKELKAASPEEVGTVAVVNCTGVVRVYQVFGNQRKPIYDSSSCDVELIDWKIPALLTTKNITELGSSPELLWNDVLDYLLSLPRIEN